MNRQSDQIQNGLQSISTLSHDQQSLIKYEIKRMEHYKLRMEHEIRAMEHLSTTNFQTRDQIYQNESKPENYIKDLRNELKKHQIRLKDHCNELEKRQMKYEENSDKDIRFENQIKKPHGDHRDLERFCNLSQHQNKREYRRPAITIASDVSSSLHLLFDLCARLPNIFSQSLTHPIIQTVQQTTTLSQQPKCDIFISCNHTNDSSIERIKIDLPQYFSIHIKNMFSSTNIKTFLDNTGTATVANITREYELDVICQADITHIFKRQFPLILVTSDHQFEPTTNWLNIIWNAPKTQKVSLDLPNFKTNLNNALNNAQWNLPRNLDNIFTIQSTSDDRSKRFLGYLHEWTIAYSNPVQVSHSYRQFINDPLRIETDQKLVEIYFNYVRIYSKNSDIISLCEKAYKENDMYHLIRAYTHPALLNETINHHLAANLLYYFEPKLHETVDYQLVKCLIDFVSLFIYREELRQYMFSGQVYRGVVMTEKDLLKFVAGSRIMNTTFLSTSKDKEVATLFSGEKQKNLAVLCTFFINGKNNRRTALNIEHISWFPQEREVLILPFSAFYVRSVQKSSENSRSIEMILVEDDPDILENTD